MDTITPRLLPNREVDIKALADIRYGECIKVAALLTCVRVCACARALLSAQQQTGGGVSGRLCLSLQIFKVFYRYFTNALKYICIHLCLLLIGKLSKY